MSFFLSVFAENELTSPGMEAHKESRARAGRP